jgi:hydrogenase maturation protease
MKNKDLVVGLGNILLSDEGAGVHAVEALRSRFDFSPDICLLDGGTLGLDLLPWIEGRERILFIDAVNLREKPGTVAVLEDEGVPSFLGPKLSFHHVGLSDLLFASSFLGNRPAKIVLVGIQPEKMDVGLTLSEAVGERFEMLLNTVLEKLREWGVEINGKAVCEKVHVPGHPV